MKVLLCNWLFLPWRKALLRKVFSDVKERVAIDAKSNSVVCLLVR